MAADDNGTDTSDSQESVLADFRSGYVPEGELDVHDNLSLHTDYQEEMDTIDYEIVRHRLYSINEEGGHTLENISGSPVAYYAQDFNPTILTEDGEVVFQGPYIQFFSPIAELQVKWILENRSENPGINPGDIFLSNDPWIGSTHQPDVFFLAPLFRDGELFCWIVNTLHQYDIGGISAGSFCPSAGDVFDEPTPIPPIKAVAGGEVRADVRDMYLRHSRLPEMVALDFNAQVSGCNVTRDRVNEAIDEYGEQMVKGVMKQIIDDSEMKYLKRIRKVPDGTWRARGYFEGSKVGDNDVYPVEIQLTKEEEELTFRNEGTGPAVGNINLTYSGFRTAIMAVMNPLLLYDELFVASGAFRHINIDTEPGTITYAEWPAAVSPSGPSNVPFAVGLIQDVMSRMLAASELKDNIITTSPSVCVASQAGVDQWGDPYGTMNLDAMGVSLGSTPKKDGIDAGGHAFSPKGPIPNMEENEQDFPILYLYKSLVEDSGGPGEFRGGVTLNYAWKPHKTEQIQTVLSGNNSTTPISAGLASYPATGLLNRRVEDSDVEEYFDEQTIPQSPEAFETEAECLAPKEEFVQKPTDVIETRNGSSPGYGDPLTRDPERVARDIERNLVSEEAANDIYGVVFERDGYTVTVDERATKERRETIREERLAGSTIPAEDGGE